MEIWYTVTGDIERRTAQDAVEWINEQLYSKPVSRLRLLVASGGGDMDSGLNLHMYLKALPFEVETIGFGKVDAAAIPIFLGGGKRVAVDGCQFFFHEGRYTIQDPTAPLHAHEESLAVFKRNLHETVYIIARETGNDTELVAKMLRRSKIMTATEAKEFGLCHSIVGTLPLQQQEQIGFNIARAQRSEERAGTPRSEKEED